MSFSAAATNYCHDPFICGLFAWSFDQSHAHIRYEMRTFFSYKIKLIITVVCRESMLFAVLVSFCFIYFKRNWPSVKYSSVLIRPC